MRHRQKIEERLARLERRLGPEPTPPRDQARRPIKMGDYVLYASGDLFAAGLVSRLSHDGIAIFGPGAVNVSRHPSEVLVVDWTDPPEML